MSDFTTRRVTMVDTQVRPSDVTKYPIISAMLTVPREAFVPAGQREAAYVGENLDIGSGHILLEARSFAKLLDALDVQPSDHVLDIGAGLGYSSAVLSRLAKSVIALEQDAEFAKQANVTLADQGVSNVAVQVGALEQGAAKSGPFDVIVVEAGVQVIPPALLMQLADGGRIGAIFMQGGLGTAKIGHMSDGRVAWRFAFNAAAPVLPGFQDEPTFAL